MPTFTPPVNTERQYVWQVASGEWFATATQTRYASRREAVAASRTWREDWAKRFA